MSSLRVEAAKDPSVDDGTTDRALFRVLRRGATGAFAVQIGGAGLGLLLHIIIARLLGVTEYGVYTLALTWVSVFSVLALLGQSSAVLRFVPGYVHRADWGKLRGLRKRMSLAVFIAGVVISLVGAVIIYGFRDRLGRELGLTLLAGLVLLLLARRSSEQQPSGWSSGRAFYSSG